MDEIKEKSVTLIKDKILYNPNEKFETPILTTSFVETIFENVTKTLNLHGDREIIINGDLGI